LAGPKLHSRQAGCVAGGSNAPLRSGGAKMLKVTGPFAIAFDDRSDKGKLRVISVTFSEEVIDQARVVGREFELLDRSSPLAEVLRKVVQ
jgi:hypothetical protein